MPGMLALNDFRILWNFGDGRLGVASAGGRGPVVLDALDRAGPLWVPDLTDPATIGCLLSLVRVAWGDEGMTIIMTGAPPPNAWVHCNYTRDTPKHPTEAEALVAALEAAP